MAQRASDRAAVQGDAYTLQSIVGVHAENDDRAQPVDVLRHVGERVVFRDAQNGGFGARDLHRVSSAWRASIAGAPCNGKPAPSWHAKPEMLPHRVKVPVIVQQRDPMLDAVSADD